MIQVVTSSRYTVNGQRIRHDAQQYLNDCGLDPSQTVTIVFIGRRKMIEIASTYKHENVALPVLAFSYKDAKDAEGLFGEIFICYPQAILLAAERGRRVDDTIMQLITHGINNLLK